MPRRATIMLVLALSVVALVVATAGAGRPPLRVAAGSAVHGSAPAAGAPTALEVTQTGSVAGPIAYSLTCDPGGGTLPVAARACGALRRDAGLLTSVPPGTFLPCPFGQSSFQITGSYGGQSVDVAFAACSTGQGPVASRWYALVPSDAARLTVALGRGIGLWRLGDRETRIRALLGAGHAAGPPCANCRRTYTTGAQVAETGNHFFRVGTTITYRRGHAIRIETNNPATLVAGTRLDAGAAALRRRLRSWPRLACPGGETRLEHGTGPSTTVVLAPFVTRVVVQRQAANCR